MFVDFAGIVSNPRQLTIKDMVSAHTVRVVCMYCTSCSLKGDGKMVVTESQLKVTGWDATV